MKKILITGGAGFIGSSLAERLLNDNYQVHIFDNLLTGNKKNISNECIFYNININNFYEISKIFDEINFDYIFHYAAVVGVKRTLENPDLVLEDLDGLKNIFSLSAKHKVNKIFFSSSSEVYGEPVHLPQDENLTPLNSKLPYAVVKNVGECYCKSFYHLNNLNYNILRFFNTYGLKQSSDFVISRFIKQVITNQDVTIHGDGSQTRTFCYIDDNIDTTINLLNSNDYNNEIINIGHNKLYSILELANLIIKITSSKSKIIFLEPLKEGDMTRRQPNNKKMLNILKRDLISLEKGLKKFI